MSFSGHCRTCGCCAHTLSSLPRSTYNRPGLPALNFRVGTHPAFLATMQTRLSSTSNSELAGLTTRETSDSSMALLDAWATVSDVLTFYQERIANEGYLRTATERRSVLEQARLVGYRPRPGVAASVYLAYSVDANSAPVIVPAGSRSNSVPAPGEQMQSFETAEDLEARSEWNRLQPRMSRPQTVSSVLTAGLFLAGTTTGLRPGHGLLLDLGSGGLQPARVQTVVPDEVANRTQLTLRDWSGKELGPALWQSAVTALTGSFAAAGESATAHRVRMLLESVGEQASSGDAAAVAAKLHDAVLPGLATELAAAEDHGYGRLARMLQSTLTQAGRAAAVLAEAGAEIPLAPPDALIAGDGRTEALLKELRRPPSVPPASPRQLERSYATAFRGGMDIYPKLLSTLFTSLAPVLYAALANTSVSLKSGLHVYALRKQAAIFGHNAPRAAQFDGNTPLPASQWSEWALTDEDSAVAHLDAGYEEVLPGQTVLIQRGPPAFTAGASPVNPGGFTVLVRTVSSAITASRSQYGMSGKSTTLVLDQDWWNPFSPVINVNPAPPTEFHNMATLRASTFFCQQEELTLAEAPVSADVTGEGLELSRLYDGLVAGRWAIVAGERTDVGTTGGVRAAELVMLAAVRQSVQSSDGQIAGGEALHTFLTFAKPLAYSYRRGTVIVYGNVAPATHGETRREILGSGNSAVGLQTFTLKQPPLTLVPAATPSGAASTLVVRVNDVQWHEAAGLSYLGPTDRSFLTGVADDGPAAGTSVTFGTGKRGARLPTGVENVRAVYRSGIGSPGNVKPEQISQLATRPLGITEVTNPIRSSGGADPESRESARANVPLAVAALDRLVSVPDYADFARTFAGVGKAAAARLTDGVRQLIQVTIAGAEDIPIDAGSDLYRNLAAALHLYGDPYQPLRLAVRELLPLVLSLNIKVSPDYAWDTVERHVRAALLERFGFDRRDLGEDLPTSTVISAAAGVRGVDYVDLDVITVLSEVDLIRGLADLFATPPPARTIPRRITAAGDRFESGVLKPAQLITLLPGVPDSLILNEVKR